MRCELPLAGTASAVQPEVLRVLLSLVRPRERIVSKNELLGVLWRTKKPRMAGSSARCEARGSRSATAARARPLIRTARGFGHRFVLAVVQHFEAALRSRLMSTDQPSGAS
jgi:hypothetical protein